MAGNNPQATMAGLKGILRWTLDQQANTSDGTTESKPVTEEDRAWLKEAMENMIDTTDHLKDCVEILNSDQKDANSVEQDDTVRQLQENALDKLMDIIDNIDFARDLGVIGGMEPLLLLLKHPKHSSLRWRAANVLGTVVQNSEVCQQWAYDKGALDAVLEQLETETNLKCSCKLFFALASLIRGFKIGMEHFINNANGLNMLIDLIKNQTIFVNTNDSNNNNGDECATTTTTTDNDKKERQNLLRKILFLFHSILGNNNETKTLLQNSNNLELLTNVILPIVILCTGYVKLNADAVMNPVGLYARDENEIMENFQLNDVAQQTLLSFFKSNNIEVFDQIVSLHPKFFEELTTKLKELQKVEGEEAMYVEDEITRCQEMLNYIPIFKPTKEWKKVIDGQQIPGGLEIRTNFETGQTFARVMQ
jgi:hypothetical protein